MISSRNFDIYFNSQAPAWTNNPQAPAWTNNPQAPVSACTAIFVKTRSKDSRSNTKVFACDECIALGDKVSILNAESLLD